MKNCAELNIALIGFGTVGSGVARILDNQAQNIAVRAGRPVRLKRVVVRDVGRSREHLPADVAVSTNLEDVLCDAEIQLAVQLIGGTDPALDFMTRLLKAGKDVVTANKALLYLHGETLFRQADEQQRTIGFEAAVAGGIPIVSAVTQALAGNQILSLEAILNGTSNFILTHMLDDDKTYDDVLKEAQSLGYAEADPAMDVDGTDATQKLAILAHLAFGARIHWSEIPRTGIEGIS
ncbi:MAG: homoserine dehydrogenase, partial [Fuerstiella sp.]|nr:homoserine dehydrogenase [Fuerstiella sp.]